MFNEGAELHLKEHVRMRVYVGVCGGLCMRSFVTGVWTKETILFRDVCEGAQMQI